MDRALVDSSFLYALYEPRDKFHEAANAYVSQNRQIKIIIPDVVLPEVAFLLRRKTGVPAVARFLSEFGTAQQPLLCIEHRNLVRAGEVMNAYPEACLDLVDCCIVALAERLNITRICTFDQRDFRIIRPGHVEFLDIIP
jgi:uncharacterized protein